MPLSRLGRYEILESLGRGAMGVVYRARDPLIERDVAIKTIDCRGLSQDEVESFERRFFREARAAGRLNHPNLVTIHDVGRDGELAYIAMELLQGHSLRQLLDMGTGLSEERIAAIIAQVADGLAYAHANGVIHRDIKPANLMVLDNGAVKIADFGVAVSLRGAETFEGTMIGSPKYMSPEQVTSQLVDGRSDIFSLGTVLYELLTGLPPFDGKELAPILHQVINLQPQAPSLRKHDLHPAFDVIIARAMAKDPALRYQFVEDMAADLRRFRLLQPEPAPIVQLPAPVAKSVPTRPTMSIRGRVGKLALAGCAVLSVAFVVAKVLQPSAPPAAVLPVAAAEAGTAGVVAAPSNPPAKPRPGGSKPPKAAPVMAKLVISATPEGEVFVDRVHRGRAAPNLEMDLPVGRHALEIRHADMPSYRRKLMLKRGERLRVGHRFEAAVAAAPKMGPAAPPVQREPAPAKAPAEPFAGVKFPFPAAP